MRAMCRDFGRAGRRAGRPGRALRPCGSARAHAGGRARWQAHREGDAGVSGAASQGALAGGMEVQVAASKYAWSGRMCWRRSGMRLGLWPGRRYFSMIDLNSLAHDPRAAAPAWERAQVLASNSALRIIRLTAFCNL